MTDKKVLRVVGCIVRHNANILMLFRTKKETDPSLWGIPVSYTQDVYKRQVRNRSTGRSR